MGRRKKTDESAEKPTVNPALEGFDITIDTFGEIKSNFDLDKIHSFLNENVEDKKLKNIDLNQNNENKDGGR